MANKKDNPLIGSFRAPVPDTPPPSGAIGEQKPAEPPKGAPDLKATGTTPVKGGEGQKPTELPKDAPDTKATGATPTKGGEGQKPAEPPKGTPDPKAAGATPGKDDEGQKPAEPPKGAPDPKATGATLVKGGEGQKPAEPPKDAPDPKATGATPAKDGKEQKPAEPPKGVPDPKATGTTPAKDGKEQKPAEPPKDAPDPKATGATPAKDGEGKSQEQADLRFVKLADIKPLPGTYVKDTPRKDYKDLIDSIKKSGLEKPVILRQGEKGEYQLVDGFLRCEALKQAGMLEIRADVYEMPLTEASRYRRDHRDKLVPLHPAEPEKPAEPPKEAEAPAAPGGQDEEIPKDFTLPIPKEGQSEIITTLKVADIHPFEGHPFNVKDDKDMWDLVDSVKKFSVLEPVVVIPRQAGGYEMVSGHRRQRACQLAGIQTMPVIVRQLDRDEATISMVDANMKRENISPMEKARAYSMKLEAMKRKAALYFKHLHLLGAIPKRRPKRRFVSRTEIIKFDRYQEQFQYLMKNRIETADQLSMQCDTLQAQIDALTDQQRELYKIRRAGHGGAAVTDEITGLTARVRELRRELKLCARIEKDIPTVSGK